MREYGVVDRSCRILDQLSEVVLLTRSDRPASSASWAASSGANSGSEALKNAEADERREAREVARGSKSPEGAGWGVAETVVRVWAGRGKEAGSTVGGSVGGARIESRSRAVVSSRRAALQNHRISSLLPSRSRQAWTYES